MGLEPLFNLIVEILRTLWPLGLIEQWERGVYVRFGRPTRGWLRKGFVLGPGIYFAAPYFAKIIPVSVVDNPLVLGKQDFTLDDGTPITVKTGAMVRVIDPMKALFEIEEYEQNAGELIQAAIGVLLVTVDRTVFDSGRKRNGLLKRIASEADSRTRIYGVQVSEVWFTSFSLALPTGRLMMD